jgi:hypothetical protein
MKTKFTIKKPFSILSLGFYSEEKELRFHIEYILKSLNTLRLGLFLFPILVTLWDVWNAIQRDFINFGMWIAIDGTTFLVCGIFIGWSFFNSKFFAIVIHPLIGRTWQFSCSDNIRVGVTIMGLVKYNKLWFSKTSNNRDVNYCFLLYHENYISMDRHLFWYYAYIIPTDLFAGVQFK